MKTNKQTNNGLACILAIFVLCFCLTFCKKHDLSEDQQRNATEKYDNSQLFKLPLASPNELTAFSNDAEIISPTVSWALCWNELKNENFFGRAEWATAKLHKTPVVIYGVDGRPRLYDFFLVNPSGELVGTITAYARKCSAVQIQNASTGIVNYETAITRTVGATRFYADRFSNRMYGAISPNNMGVNVPLFSMATNEAPADLTPAEMTDDELLEWLRNTFLPMALEDPAAVEVAYTEIHKRWLIEKAQRDAVWNAIGTPTDQDVDTTEWNPISAPESTRTRAITFISPTIIVPITSPDFNVETDGGDLAWITEYQTMFTKYNYSETEVMCGPWVAAFILTTNNYLVDNKYVDPNGGMFEVDKPMTAPMLHYSLVDYSEGKVSLNLIATGVSDIYSRIRNNAKSGVRLFWCNGQLHWALLYGSYRVPGFLGIDFYYRFMNADNGSYVSLSYRSLRDPRNPENYTKATWEQAFYAVNDYRKADPHLKLPYDRDLPIIVRPVK